MLSMVVCKWPCRAAGFQISLRCPLAAMTSKPSRSLSDYLFILWIAGAIAILARYLIGTLIMMRVAYKGERIEDGEWLVLAQRTARELGAILPAGVGADQRLRREVIEDAAKPV